MELIAQNQLLYIVLHGKVTYLLPNCLSTEEQTLIPSIRGDNVARGKSALKDKVGKKIAGDNVSIADDGTLPGGLHTGRTDMEGVPKQKTPIIANGTLQGFLYDNYWGNIENRESTGNARRGGGRLQLPPYGTLPSVNPSNIIHFSD